MLSIDSPKSSIITVRSSAEPSLLHSQTLEAALAADLSLVPEVEHIFVERADNTLLVWTSLEKTSKDVREKVFQKQFDIIEGFPEVSFDFNLVSGKDRPPADLASAAKLIYSRPS